MRYILLSIYVLTGLFLRAQPPIGYWREHLPYNSAIDVAAGDGIVYCATPYSLFSVEVNSRQTERLSRVTGLNETGVSAIAYDQATGKLFIAYDNSNIDILYRSDIFNVPDIKRDNIIGDKHIYNIYPSGGNFYLSTGLGVVVIDGSRYEVKDSWFIGAGGNQVRVNGFAFSGGFYYAATAEGLKTTAASVSNPADYSNWTVLGGSNGLDTGACRNVVSVQDKVIALQHDSLFVRNGTHWDFFYTGWPVVSVRVSENKLLVCERQSGGASRVVILNPDGSAFRVLANSGAVSFPRQAILYNGNPWVADQFACLSRFGNSAAYDNYTLNSPQEKAGGQLLTDQQTFYATAGAVNDAWNYQYNGDGIYVFRNGTWTNINRYRYSQLDTLLDYMAIAIDPADESIWAGSYGGGLLHVREGPAFDIYKQGILEAPPGDPGSYRVAGLAFDRDRNLWVSNFGAPRPLKIRKADGSWIALTIPYLLFENAVSQIIIDDNNYKWIVSPLGNGLICFDSGNTPDNTGDDRWRKLGAGAGNGGLPNSEVLCAAQDRNGYIWVGTTDGIGVIQCPGDIFSATGCDAVLPVVPNGNFAGYLFKGQQVQAIAVDGADRKWVGTRTGVFLVSAEGDKVINRFTEENSPLLSSNVSAISIDGKTGEVFFATGKGICSFRGTATTGTPRPETVQVFPNPVPPGYTGSIGIRGLSANAIVKITETNGRLVYQARALGGQAVWDGRDYRGSRISTGVYLVLVTDENHQETTAAKIFFIQR